MKKIIALAVAGLFVTACDFDLREDEQAATTIKYATITGRGATPYEGTLTAGVWTDFQNEDGEAPSESFDAAVPPAPPNLFGRIIVFTTDGLLDGASIEETPQSCDPAGDWLTVTTTAALPAGGQWYSCYYPSSATTDDGASVFIFYATTPPGTTTNSQPVRSGIMLAGDYTLDGDIRSSNGSTISISAAWTTVP